MKPNLTKLNMTEWDKMQEHQIYNDFDTDLFNLRVKAKKLFKEFNCTEDEEVELSLIHISEPTRRS